MTKYTSCTDARDVCEWLDEHPDVLVVAITQGRFDTYTIFYRKYDENDVRKIFATCCDPCFSIPADRVVQTPQSPRTVRKDAVPEPSVVC